MAEKKFEPMKVDWHPGMTYEEEKKFFKGFVNELVDRENKRREPGFFEFFKSHNVADICHGGPEPWQPVYDDIMVSYLDAFDRRKCEKKGFTREQTVEFAKKKVLDKAWQDCVCRAYHWDRDQQVDNPYENREHFDRKCAEGDLPVSRMMRVVMKKCDPANDWYDYDYPGWEEAYAERLGRKLRLDECETGNQVLDIIKDNHYRRFFNSELTSCEIDSKDKVITMPYEIERPKEALSMTYAAAVIKQEANGVGMSKEDVAIRKADALAMQASLAAEMSEKVPEIMESFIERGNKPIYDAFIKTMGETNNTNAARSAAVDCYLNAALKGEKPAAEKIASVCKDAKGQSYYIDPKSVAAMKEAAKAKVAQTKADEKREDLNNIFKESAFNTAFMAKAKQGGR